MIQLKTGFYPFWDDCMTDAKYTDAVLSVNRPERIGTVMTADRPWEGNQTNIFNIIREDGFYRAYYQARNYPETYETVICCAESRDGIVWNRPELGICEFQGSKKNNILLSNVICNFVMKDPNPECPQDEIYKMFEPYSPTNSGQDRVLKCYTSGDGIHFKEHHVCETPSRYTNMFDSTNSVIWDPNDGKYYCFFRGYHTLPPGGDKTNPEGIVREVRVMSSDDCVHFGESEPLDYSGSMDYQIYTACVFPYLYDDRYYIGFPTRYNVRAEWDDCYEKLTGKDDRLARMKDGSRLGFAVTDCLFMSSRDRKNWYRFDEAAITPGPEDGYNWEYGDCFPVQGLYETAGRVPGSDNELSLYSEVHHWTDKPVELERYVYRRDGFASYKAGFREKTLRTLPLTVEGSRLSLNFRSSARGYIKVSVLDEYRNPIDGYVSCAHFGDTTHRLIGFDKPLSELAGRKVCLDFAMSDAELYSMTIE